MKRLHNQVKKMLPSFICSKNLKLSTNVNVVKNYLPLNLNHTFQLLFAELFAKERVEKCDRCNSMNSFVKDAESSVKNHLGGDLKINSVLSNVCQLSAEKTRQGQLITIGKVVTIEQEVTQFVKGLKKKSVNAKNAIQKKIFKFITKLKLASAPILHPIQRILKLSACNVMQKNTLNLRECF